MNSKNGLIRASESEVAQYLSRAGKAALYTKTSPTKEPSTNEDVAALLQIDDKTAVLAVADGLGGARAGAQAAELAVEAVISSVKDAIKSDHDLRIGIINGFEEANRKVLAMGVGAGTTLAVAEIRGDTLRAYHVGDSSVLALGNRGKLKFQTVAHSPVGFAVHSGMLDEKEAIHHEERHLVHNVVGSEGMSIEVGPTLKLSPRDTIIVSSDALFDNLHLEEIVNLARKGKLEDVAHSLVTLCEERMINNSAPELPSKPDDLTFIIFRPQ